MKLFAFERRWLLCIFETILPGHTEAGFPPASSLPLDRFLQEFFRHTPPGSSIGVRLAAWAVMLLPLFWKLRPFSRLKHEDRIAFLDGMAGSNLYFAREIPMLLKLVACLGYGGSPEVSRAFGATALEGPLPEWLEAGR